MNQVATKIVARMMMAILLVLSTLLSFSCCNLNNSNSHAQKITTKMPWYNAEITVFNPETNPNKQIETLYHQLAGSDDKYLAVYSDGRYKIPDPSGTTDAIQMVTIIDRITKQTVKTINLFDVVNRNDNPKYAAYSAGKIIVYVDSWNPDTNDYSFMEYEFDVDTEMIINTYDFGFHNVGFQFPSEYHIGKYRVEIDRPVAQVNTSYYVMRIFTPDGDMSQIEVKDFEGIYGIPAVFALDDTTVLFPAAVSRSYKYFKLDLSTCELTEVNSADYSWIDLDQFLSIYNDSNGNAYFTTTQGVSKIDINNKAIEECLNYSNSNINRNYTSRLNIADYSEEKMLLCGRFNTSNMFEPQLASNFVIVELTKAVKNPHAGKTILELYIKESEMNDVIADAILKYNEINKKYYIRITDKYNINKYIESYENINSDDELNAAYMNADAQMSYEIAMDIMNGEGPDILMNTLGMGQLNNNNYLIDLAPYLSNLDSNKYFTNVIEKSYTNGKLYQLPISFTIEGIQTDPQYAGISGEGFTTNEYETFLHDALNGKDIIESGQVLYFIKLFNSMSDEFIKDGKIDFSGREFAALAEFVKDNVPENSVKWEFTTDEDMQDSEGDETSLERNKIACLCNCPGIGGYLVKRADIKNGTAILGIPSTDGRGPMFGPDISIAISAGSLNKEACIDFVNLLLSDEVQSELALSDRFVLNRNEFRKVCEKAIEYYNTPEVQLAAMDYSLGTTVRINTKFTVDDINNLEKIILSCSKMDSHDSSIYMIFSEELPAYFSGQKELDDVIKIIQDRAQRVLDERN